MKRIEQVFSFSFIPSLIKVTVYSNLTYDRNAIVDNKNWYKYIKYIIMDQAQMFKQVVSALTALYIMFTSFLQWVQVSLKFKWRSLMYDTPVLFYMCQLFLSLNPRIYSSQNNTECYVNIFFQHLVGNEQILILEQNSRWPWASFQLR